MEIFLEGLGKRYQRDWIFQDLDFVGAGPQTVALLGPNGAGKSTLLRIVAGLAVPSTGRVGIRQAGREWLDEEHTRRCAFTAPYLELPEELPFKELLRFHFRFRPLLPGIALADLPEILQLQAYVHRPVQQFSSGMKQRVRLGLTLFTGVPFLFLDEPLTNLDSRGETWYNDLVAGYRRGRFLMVASNRPEEYTFCDQTMRVTDYRRQAGQVRPLGESSFG